MNISLTTSVPASARMLHWYRGLRSALVRARDRRVAIGELSRLPDYALEDIGLQRAQIRASVDAMLRRKAANDAPPILTPIGETCCQ